MLDVVRVSISKANLMLSTNFMAQKSRSNQPAPVKSGEYWGVHRVIGPVGGCADAPYVELECPCGARFTRLRGNRTKLEKQPGCKHCCKNKAKPVHHARKAAGNLPGIE